MARSDAHDMTRLQAGELTDAGRNSIQHESVILGSYVPGSKANHSAHDFSVVLRGEEMMFRRTVFGLAVAAFAVVAQVPPAKAGVFDLDLRKNPFTNGSLDPFNRNNSLGGYIPTRSTPNADSGTQSITRPFIDGNGNVWTGSASNGSSGTIVARAVTIYDAQGLAWWVSPTYRGNIWGVVERKRAPSYLDRPVQQMSPIQPPQQSAFNIAPPQYTPPPMQNVQPRFYYREFDGTKANFTSLGGGSWVNLTNGAKYHFTQVGGDNDSIILRDKSRNLNVMLKADGTKYWSNGNGWNGLGQGLGVWSQ
jgi:hypothetical protein